VKHANSHITEEMVAHWRRVGPLLARIRRQELRCYDHKKNELIIDGLLQIGFERAIPRYSSGLVELQRLLAKGGRGGSLSTEY
jgi:hypothetical protein